MARNSLAPVLARGKGTGAAITPAAFLRTLGWRTDAGRATRAQIVGDGHALALAKTGDPFHADIARLAQLPLAGLDPRPARNGAASHALPRYVRAGRREQHPGPIAGPDRPRPP